MEADGDADRAEVAFEGNAVLLEPGVGIGLDKEVQIVGPPVLPTGNERGAAAENQVLFPAEMGGEMHPCPVQKRGGSTGQVHSGHGLGFAVGRWPPHHAGRMTVLSCPRAGGCVNSSPAFDLAASAVAER